MTELIMTKDYPTAQLFEGPQVIATHKQEPNFFGGIDFISIYEHKIKSLPHKFTMTVPEMDGIGAMYCICLNELSKQNGSNINWSVKY